MTIQEVEARTGIPRASVRYYESEGLILPERDGNRYRNYSEEDLKKLEKIKLLRTLELSIEELRQLDENAAGLACILEKKREELARRGKELAAADAVISRMLEDGADYASLDTEKYAAALRDGPQPVLPPEEPEYASPGRWYRWGARALDHALAQIVNLFIWVVIFKNNSLIAPTRQLMNPVIFWLGRYGLQMAIVLLTEPVLLTLFGTTPGKWLMGIRVTDMRGRRLGYFDAVSRTLGVLIEGYGLNIPILSQIMLLRAFVKSEKGEDFGWDGFNLERAEGARGVGFGAAVAAVFAVMYVIMVAVPAAPPHRGELTRTELVENYNYYIDWHNFESFHMTPDLDWVEIPNSVSSLDSQRPIVTVLEENGAVTEVRVALRREEGVVTGSDQVCVMEDMLRAALLADSRNAVADYRSLEGAIRFVTPCEFEMNGWRVSYDVEFYDGSATVRPETMTFMENTSVAYSLVITRK